MTATLLCWLALLVAGYAFVGYPALAIGLARWRSAQRGQSSPARIADHARDPWLPPLTVVIAARNEAPRIADRLRNLLDSDYPSARLRILLVDDGSDDGTTDAARALGDPRISVLRLGSPAGKAIALSAAMRQVDSELTVFADARQRFEPQALRALAIPFADRTVGAVTGELQLLRSDDDAAPVASNGAYWRLERALRAAEAELGWAHAASGAIYAIRTRLFQPLPDGLILDDLYTPLQVVRAGARIVHAPAAVALDSAGQQLAGEFRRKLRTLTGNWQLLALLPWLADPRRNPLWFAWVSHKLARLVAPWALLVALGAAAAAPDPLTHGMFWLQLAAWLLAVAAIVAPAVARRVPLASSAGSFLALNAAALLSLPVYLRNRDLGHLWKH
jgi:poly-beta-1,6-N-acetyl-D-glucosamine synthase